MKKILSIFVLLSSIVLSVGSNVHAQPTGNPSTTTQYRGGLGVDSFYLPPIYPDTPAPATNARCRRDGSVIRVVKTAGDTLLYQFKRKWYLADATTFVTASGTTNYLSKYLTSSSFTTANIKDSSNYTWIGAVPLNVYGGRFNVVGTDVSVSNPISLSNTATIGISSSTTSGGGALTLGSTSGNWFMLKGNRVATGSGGQATGDVIWYNRASINDLGFTERLRMYVDGAFAFNGSQKYTNSDVSIPKDLSIGRLSFRSFGTNAWSYLGEGWYYDTTSPGTYRAKNTQAATRLDFTNGDFSFQTAPQVSSGSVLSFTPWLRIANSGKVYYNTSTDYGYGLNWNGSAYFIGDLRTNSYLYFGSTNGYILGNGAGVVQFRALNGLTITGYQHDLVADGATLSVSGTTAGSYINNAFAIGKTSGAVSSATLELSGTTKGFLPNRMTGAQAEAISSPAEGLLIYATDGSGVTITSKGWWGYTGSTWAKLN